MKKYKPELRPAWKMLNISLLLHCIYFAANIAILIIEWKMLSAIFINAQKPGIIITNVGIPLISACVVFMFHLSLFFIMRRLIANDSLHLGAIGIIGVIYSICSISIIPHMTSLTTRFYSQSVLLQQQMMLVDVENNMGLYEKYMATNSTISAISSLIWYIFVAASVFFMLSCAFCWSYNNLRHIFLLNKQEAPELT